MFATPTAVKKPRPNEEQFGGETVARMDQSPYQALGKPAIPAQDALSPVRRVFAENVLSFNPFHCLPPHQPLESINQVRIKAYEASAAYRHAMNAQPRLEPRGINQLPD